MHFRIASPPTHGTRTSTASTRRSATSCSRPPTTSRRCAPISAPTASPFLSIDGLYRALGHAGRNPDPPQVHRSLLHRRLPETGAHRSRHRDPQAPVDARRGRLKFSGVQETRWKQAAREPRRGRHRGPRAASAAPPRWNSPAPARMSWRSRATQGALEELDDEIRALGGTGDPRAAGPQGSRRPRPGSARLSTSATARSTCCSATPASLGQLAPINPGGTRHLGDAVMTNHTSPAKPAPDPLARSAPARLRAPAPRDHSSRRARPTRPRPIGGPYQFILIPSRRRRLEGCWRGTPNADEIRNITKIKVMLVNPGPRCAPACAPPPCPAKDPLSLKTPEDLAPKILELALPSWQEDRQGVRFSERPGAGGQGAGVKGPADDAPSPPPRRPYGPPTSPSGLWDSRKSYVPSGRESRYRSPLSTKGRRGVIPSRPSSMKGGNRTFVNASALSG